ncbi:MAG: ROK family protein [Verrucomicrobia bacterium]|nr:ROK family protein [Verrucomicrobiota bacterium]
MKHRPRLDPDFIPAVLWNRDYAARAAKTPGSKPLAISLERGDSTVSVHRTMVLPQTAENSALNIRYVERLLKFLLWQRGGYRVRIAGEPEIAAAMKAIYSPGGARAFDHEFMGRKVYGRPMEVEACDEVPEPREASVPLGRNLDGCRIGFDLGGSDRKCAALIDGKVVFSEEVRWDPYFQNDPRYHYDGIRETLRRAAEHLPRVDAIGGSAAGVYVNNEVRVASLFRGVPEDDFEKRVRRIFFDLQKEWGGIPFEVVNDGEVTALAGSMSMNDSAVLGISLGTSLAAGYVDPDGHIRPWLNELAFAPVDYRENAPADEWSGDAGCGVQYFSQQGVARLAPLAGVALPAEMPFAEQLVEVQRLMAEGDPRARAIYETIGTCFGYAVAHYADFYEIRNLLILGRVTSGEGGGIILENATTVLRDEFPGLAIRLCTPDEKDKRHGQAVAAASLPKTSIAP